MTRKWLRKPWEHFATEEGSPRKSTDCMKHGLVGTVKHSTEKRQLIAQGKQDSTVFTVRVFPEPGSKNMNNIQYASKNNSLWPTLCIPCVSRTNFELPPVRLQS